jgi:hypothetical protein
MEKSDVATTLVISAERGMLVVGTDRKIRTIPPREESLDAGGRGSLCSLDRRLCLRRGNSIG